MVASDEAKEEEEAEGTLLVLGMGSRGQWFISSLPQLQPSRQIDLPAPHRQCCSVAILNGKWQDCFQNNARENNCSILKHYLLLKKEQ